MVDKVDLGFMELLFSDPNAEELVILITENAIIIQMRLHILT